MKKFALLCTLLFALLTTSYCQSQIFEDAYTSGVDLPQVDDAVHSFMETYNVPELAVAITRGERLVYAKTYGTDSNVDSAHRFRIASLSKPITAIAIMKLVEEGSLSLNDKVFGSDGILGTTYGTQPYHQWVTDVTVLHLLQQTAGGWGNSPFSNDPMFRMPSASVEELISWTLDNQLLTSAPGSRYAYSNFGYCLLGRIIERVTGQTYENYVRSEILSPLGINTMEIAGNTLADRKTNEVQYFGQNGQNPYGFNIERMDSHGGWIGTAVDLVRLLVHADGFSNKPDILSSSSIRTMTTGSSANSGYAMGWFVNRSGNWWHSGSIPGGFSYLVRTSGGFNWAILMNTRSPNSQFAGAVDRLIWRAVSDPDTQWPDGDWF